MMNATKTLPRMNISFSPPDITDIEINEVVDTLKSGWITTGPKTKAFEKKIIEFKAALVRGSAPLASTLLAEMLAWLVQHICIEDKKYAVYFKSKGFSL